MERGCGPQTRAPRAFAKLIHYLVLRTVDKKLFQFKVSREMSTTQPMHLKTGAHGAARLARASFSYAHMVNRILPVTRVWRDGGAWQCERD
jgi:hypothetical protein